MSINAKITYHPWKTNQVADALNLKSQMVVAIDELLEMESLMFGIRRQLLKSSQQDGYCLYAQS